MRILVTGANRGIGLEFVRQYLARGERVFATCRRPGQAHELTRLALSHPGHLKILPLDLSKPASVVELERELHLVTDALDVVVNNAGMLVSGERWGAIESKSLLDSFATNAARFHGHSGGTAGGAGCVTVTRVRPSTRS